MEKVFLFAVCILLLSGCRKHREHPVDFYYWKTNVSIGDVEKEYFNALHCRKLYMRFFDVDSKGGVMQPVAKILPFDAGALDAGYVPVVFITNRTFTGMQQAQIQALAQNIARLTDEIRTANMMPEVDEIQIDCDWTESTQNAYFRFLKALETVTRIRITCTIRLHQIKYREKTGVPPVAKGYLMCYATSDPKDADGRNSILDMTLLRDYTARIGSYPLDFDVALPLFSWAVVTNHLGQIKLINNVNRDNLDMTFLRPLTDGSYEVTDDFFFQGFYLNKGFTVRLESVSPALLREAKEYLDRKIKKPYGIVYYHLDEPFLQQYTINTLCL
jgi:hypothetical protein